MAIVWGDTKSLKASEQKALQRLGSHRTPVRDVVNRELIKRASKLASDLGRFIGVLIQRDGRISHVVLGGTGILYLPDLGRFRLSKARLRRLRLIVFPPESEGQLKKFRNINSSIAVNEEKSFLSPEISTDLITDLEKLRFDLVAVVSSSISGGSYPVSLVHLEPIPGQTGVFTETLPSKELSFTHAEDVNNLDLDFEQFISELEQRFSASQNEGIILGQEKVILVGAYSNIRDSKASIEELAELARTAGLSVVDTIIQVRKKLDPRTLVGKGKLESIVLEALDLGVDLIIFDKELSPGQLRSITNSTELRVLDRSMLILDIFAQRAVSSEGRLQVELAQLRYSLPRLTETDTGLSRLTGGIGGRGPGETKLEIGRRRARKRITDLEKKISKVTAQRDLRRERRRERGVPVVALVGYTNAGKSTLLNCLTSSKVVAEDKLFATLDPTTRRMRFPDEREVVFVDTVGFIRELPKELVSAFRATLEEIGEADLLIHVVDSTNPECEKQITVVRETLAGLGYGSHPEILVFNKVDRLSVLERESFKKHFDSLAISAINREGMEKLITAVQKNLAENFKGLDPGSFVSDLRGD